MKKFFLFFFLTLVLPLGAEVVSSVSFNPSRMGKYDVLKVSGGANLLGGLQTVNMNISKSVTLDAGQVSSGKAAVSMETVTGNTGEINMSDTIFQGSIGTLKSYNPAESFNGSTVPTVTVGGGTGAFTSGFISDLTNAASLRVSAGTLQGADVSVTGEKSLLVDISGASAPVKGFKLGGNVIPPFPSGITCNSLAWSTKEGTSVLALTDCSGTPTTGDGTEGEACTQRLDETKGEDISSGATQAECESELSTYGTKGILNGSCSESEEESFICQEVSNGVWGIYRLVCTCDY